jgi:hypothetical protein
MYDESLTLYQTNTYNIYDTVPYDEDNDESCYQEGDRTENPDEYPVLQLQPVFRVKQHIVS